MPSLGFMSSQGFLQKLQIVGRNVKYKNISFLNGRRATNEVHVSDLLCANALTGEQQKIHNAHVF